MEIRAAEISAILKEQ
nr:F1-ATPase alpha subunit {N-terminal} [Rhodospirillum rubrum, S1, chromatophores, Peptide Partial, 15 aa] [Rhodospirillum rubrum]